MSAVFTRVVRCAKRPTMWKVHWRMLWLTALLALSSCGPTTSAPAWFPPQPSVDSYQGEGEAGNCAAALERARRSLCEDIKVVVQSDATDARNHVFRQLQTAAGDYQSAHFNEVVRIQSTTHARCVFAGMPIHEKREQSGGQCFVVLTLGMADYQAYLAQHTAVVRLSGPQEVEGIPLQAGPLLEAAANHLRHSGYVVLAQGPSQYEAVLELTASLTAAGDEFANVQVATGSATWVLLRLSDQAEMERLAIPASVARGFAPPQALLALMVDLANSLKESWRLP